MSIRGTAAIVGFAEIPIRRNYPGRTTLSLMAEASLQAIRDAGLRKEDIDGIITPEGTNALTFGEYIWVHHAYNAGMTAHVARGATSIPTAAAAINVGYCDYVLCVFASLPLRGTWRLVGPSPASSAAARQRGPWSVGDRPAELS